MNADELRAWSQANERASRAYRGEDKPTLTIRAQYQRAYRQRQAERLAAKRAEPILTRQWTCAVCDAHGEGDDADQRPPCQPSSPRCAGCGRASRRWRTTSGG